MEKPQDGARVSDGTVRQSCGFGSDPSSVLLDIHPAAASAERDSGIEVEASRISESEDDRKDSPSVNAGIERSVLARGDNGVLNAGAAPQEPVSLQLALAPQAAPREVWMRGFEIGDLVWVKVKSHPWWPGYIYNVSLAAPDVRRTRKEGHLLVAFFGDNSYGWFVPDELIPFEPYYLEELKQTSSKKLILAVDEALDEERRRAALGLTCRCRNARNFRCFGFPGYVRVDVPGYERGAAYSVKQIETIRESFVPEELLSFLLQLALAPRSEEPWGIDFIRGKARLLAYRMAVYEEYDEAYLQAFGVEPVRSSPNDAEAPDQPDCFAPRANGQLRIAENLDDMRPFFSSLRPATSGPKIPCSSSKTKYVPKKQREAREVKHTSSSGGSSRPTPLLHSPLAKPYETTGAVQYHKSPRGQATESSSQAGNYVLHKSPQLTSKGSKAGTSAVQQASAIGSNMKSEPFPTNGHSSNNLSLQEIKPGIDLPASNHQAEEERLKARAGTYVSGVMKKEKAQKHLRDDGGSVGREDNGGIKKNKKKKVLRIEAGPSKQPRDDVLDFPRLLNNLQELAADHLYVIEPNALSVVLQAFCKFRLQVYQKSLHPPESVHDMSKPQAIRVDVGRSLLEPGAGNADMAFGKEAKQHREPSSSTLKLLKPRLKPDDPKKSGHKRGPSNQLEQLNEKKVKKMNQLNELAIQEKAGISLRKPEGQQRHQKEPSTATVKASTASAKPNNKVIETVKKKEPPPPRLPSSPTALELKFSLGTSLPSVAKLKARLAVFGPLVKDATRVYWNSNTCRVVFENKPHAEAALNYARKNDLLIGPLRCSYIRELDPATLKPLSNPGKLLPPQSHRSGGPQLRPGNGGQPRASPYQQQRAPTVQLKSISMKPGDVGRGFVGDAARKPPQRVTFILDGRDNRVEPPVVPAASHGNGGSYVVGSSSSLPLMDPMTFKNPKSSGLLPLPPPPLHFTLLNPPRAVDKQCGLPPPLPPSIPPPPRAADRSFPSISLPPPPHVVGGPLPPPPPLPRIMDRFEAGGPGLAQLNQSQPQHNEQQAVVEGRNGPDISNQMLILLRRCSDIVTNIKSSLGYLPYHPL